MRRKNFFTLNRVIFLLLAIVVALFATAWFRFGSETYQEYLASETTTPTPKLKTPQPSLSPTPSRTPNPTQPSDNSLIIKGVPFTPQAPFGNWSDRRQQDGCEEASALMAVYWFRDKSLTLSEAEREILKMSDFEAQKYGSYHDTSPADTVSRILKEYFNYQNAEAVRINNTDDIKNELRKGNLVLVQVDGQVLQNPYYSPPGPDRHMLVVTGFDTSTREFITNDPGTKQGHNYRYDEYQLWEAMRDYPTGNHLPITEIIRSMIVVRPE